MGYEHEEPEPVVVEAPDTEPVAEASVEVARIEADRDVKVAKIEAGTDRIEIDSRVDALEAKIDGMREVLDRLAPEPEPEPEPEPVVVEPGPPAPDVPPPPADEPHHRAPKGRSGMFGF